MPQIHVLQNEQWVKCDEEAAEKHNKKNTEKMGA